jgi:hypothetical protein
MSQMDLLRLGMAMHTFQDAGAEGCPHWGYVGYPSRLNWERSRELMRIDWWERALAAVRPSLRDKPWGHALDPKADQIQRCRQGALTTMSRLWEWLTDRPVVWHSPKDGIAALPCYEGPPGYGFTGIQTLRAIEQARDDQHLVTLCQGVVRNVTGLDMPPFRPFAPDSREWVRLSMSGLLSHCQ